MSIKEDAKINFIQGEENAKIKQYFDPKNTSNGISYSLAQFTLEIGEKTKLHKIKSSEIYYILEGNGKLRIDGNEFELKRMIQYMCLQIQNNFLKTLDQKNYNFCAL